MEMQVVMNDFSMSNYKLFYKCAFHYHLFSIRANAILQQKFYTFQELSQITPNIFNE